MTDIAGKVSNRLRGESYVSEDVRRHLEKLARLLTREWDPRVKFQNHKTAATRLASDEMEIIITDSEISQPVTNINDDAWQLLAREALLIHEIGHVKYTDFEAHEEVMSEVSMSEKAQVQMLWNAIEDAVVDQQLRWKFNCSDELDTHLANLFGEHKDSAREMELLSAVHLAILEKGVYPVGILDEYQEGSRQLVPTYCEDDFDKALEMVDEVLVDTMTEPDARTRYERMLEFWEDLKDLYQGISGHSAGGGFANKIPDDTSGMTPGGDADELEDLSEDDVETLVMSIGAPPEEEVDDDDGGEEQEHGSHTESGDEADEDQEESDAGGKGSEGEETGDDADSDGPDESGTPDGYEPFDLGEHEGHNLAVID